MRGSLKQLKIRAGVLMPQKEAKLECKSSIGNYEWFAAYINWCLQEGSIIGSGVSIPFENFALRKGLWIKKKMSIIISIYYSMFR